MSQKAPHILLVSASKAEMFDASCTSCHKLVTGVGMVATTFAVTQALQAKQYDLVINLGIAGSFNPDHIIGDVVQVVSDRFSELGVEDNERFVPADEMNLVPTQDLWFETNLRVAGLLHAKGITVNRVHGAADSIEIVKAQCNPSVESMEGAAVAYVCQQFDVPWVQLRAISNRVEPRNRDAWNIPLAIKNLHSAVAEHIRTVVDDA